MGRPSLGAFGAHTTREPCSSVEDLTAALREAIEAAPTSAIPDCTNVELSLAPSALLQLHRPAIGPYADGGEQDVPPEFKTKWADAEDDLQQGRRGGEKKSHPVATVQEVLDISEPEVRATVQRAASRGIQAAVEGVDGYRYNFTNAWASKDQDGLRFSFICQDSHQNKDRHANGRVRRDRPPRSGAMRKSTWDCKGCVSVKCSLTKGHIEVAYRHFGIHPTVEERRGMSGPGLRPSMNGWTPAAREEDDGDASKGGLLGALQSEYSASLVSSRVLPPPSNAGQKRKRDADAPAHGRSSNGCLSLAELLKRSDGATKPLQSNSPPLSNNTKPTMHPPPVQYDLPSWEHPPPPPPPVRRSVQALSSHGPYPAPYQPPYTPSPHPQGQHHQPPPPQYYPPQQAQDYPPPPRHPQRPSGPQAPGSQNDPFYAAAQPVSNDLPARHQSQPLFMTLKAVKPGPQAPPKAPPTKKSPSNTAGGMRSQAETGRDESLDPWFPKR